MNFFVLFFFAYYAVIFLIVAIHFLLLVSLAFNRWLLKRKLKLRYRILLSIGVPILLVVLAFLDIYYAPYSTSNMDSMLSQLVPEIKLPTYKITEYSSVYVGGDDLKDTYHIVFKDGKDESLRSKLDSLVIINPKWKRNGNEYVYDTIFFENEIVDSIIVRPMKGTATFIRYKW
jgi:hypothetical protein